MVFLTAVVLVHERMISFCPCLKFVYFQVSLC
jgi:hypothetical protein